MAKPLSVLDLFSGIGGFSLGLERTNGFETVAFCEIDPFCRKVLRKHWPDVPIYKDVKTLTADILSADGISVDVITGGFPCQDISTAGKLGGLGDGTRSGLWSEIVRLTSELRPRYVIVENVSNLLAGPSDKRGAWFGRVLGDLAALGYDAEWHCIPASYVGAPHRRDRVWIVANPNSRNGKSSESGGPRLRRQVVSEGADTDIGCTNSKSKSLAHPNSERELQPQGCEQYKRRWIGDCGSHVADASSWRQPRQGQSLQQGHPTPRLNGQTAHAFASRVGQIWGVEPDVGRVAHGIPMRMDRLKSLGNAVVPQIPEMIGRAILDFENGKNTR